MIVVEISLEGLLEETVTGKRVGRRCLPGAAISADYPWLPNNCGSPAGLPWGSDRQGTVGSNQSHDRSREFLQRRQLSNKNELFA